MISPREIGRLAAARVSTWGGKMAALGLVGVLLNLVVVHAALTGVHDVDVSYEGLTRLGSAQRYFQHADMMHDALHADVLEATLPPGENPVLAREPREDIRRDAASYRDDLARVDAIALPRDIERQLADLRPIQDQYITEAVNLASSAENNSPLAGPASRQFLQGFEVLETRQAQLTAALSLAGERAKAQADAGERSVQIRLVVSAVGAILGFLFLAYLLLRVGRALTAMIRQQRDVAETLQHSLLPEQMPELVGVNLAARYLAGGRGVEVGGDWYDVIVLPNGQVGLAMGDVVGHDLGAAAVMGQLRNALRAYAVESDNPGDVLERLNRFCHQQGVSDMASCIYAVLDPASGLLRMASAGHYPPLLTSGSGTAHFLECRPAPPIGAVREIHYPVTERRLPPDGVLILYTDGLVERRDAAVDEGLARLRTVAVDKQAENLDQLGDLIISNMFDGSVPQDDVALLMIAPKSRLGNRIELVYEARSSSLAQLRRTVSRWLEEEGATDQESYEILVSCSEAATNAIEHAYGPGSAHFSVTCVENDGAVEITVRDWGKWRSARGQDRGRGRLLMEGLMDEVRTTTAPGGTEVWMRRRLTMNAEAVPSPRERVGA